MKNSELLHMLNSVCDEVSFISFLNALSKDKADEARKERESPSSPYGPGANGWENDTIDDFLESAAAWAQNSIAGMKSYQQPTNVWTRCADILHGGKIYE